MSVVVVRLLLSPPGHDVSVDACWQLRRLANSIGALRACSVRLRIEITLAKRLLLRLHHLQAFISYVAMSFRLLLEHVADLYRVLLRTRLLQACKSLVQAFVLFSRGDDVIEPELTFILRTGSLMMILGHLLLRSVSTLWQRVK